MRVEEMCSGKSAAFCTEFLLFCNRVYRLFFAGAIMRAESAALSAVETVGVVLLQR